ncbi:MAG: aminopeptidase P family protein [Clostridia bacterium]|nr:aminopeptidase P family protein [Clostridia bacterium]
MFFLPRVRARMAEEQLSGLIITSPSHLHYLTGLDVPSHDRLNALLLTQERADILSFHLSPLCPEGFSVRLYQDPDAAPRLLADWICKYAAGPVLGVDGTLPSRYLLPLMDLVPEHSFRCTRCVEQVRMIKEPEEIEKLHRASAITDRVFSMAFSQLREGMTELAFGHVFSDCFEACGAGPFPGHPMVAFGKGTADVHHIPGDYVLRPGDAVMVDTGKAIDGYYSDMTRTVFWKSATPRQIQVYETVLEANRKALSCIRPGISLRNVHTTACDVIRAAGYGSYYPHRTSHGIGMDYHEEPFDTASSTHIIAEGMCFSVEPGIYLPDAFGVRIEDLVAVTHDGFRLLTHADKALTILGI